jgi:hypothetical protein
MKELSSVCQKTTYFDLEIQQKIMKLTIYEENTDTNYNTQHCNIYAAKCMWFSIILNNSGG